MSSRSDATYLSIAAGKRGATESTDTGSRHGALPPDCAGCPGRGRHDGGQPHAVLARLVRRDLLGRIAEKPQETMAENHCVQIERTLLSRIDGFEAQLGPNAEKADSYGCQTNQLDWRRP